jgi:hypothetical protein
MKKIFSLATVLFFAVIANASQYNNSALTNCPDSGITVTDRKSNEMIIVPNPSSNGIQVKVKVNKAATGTITIFDAAGKQVYQQEAALQEGNNKIVINDIIILNEGSYTVKLTANKETFSSRLMIWK